MSFVYTTTSYIEDTQTGNPRVLHHREVVVGEAPKDFIRWFGVVNVRLPLVQEGAEDLLPDGSIPWMKDAKGEVMHRDMETNFPIEGVHPLRKLPLQIQMALAQYDTLARQCAEAMTEEYKKDLLAFKEKAMARKNSKIVLPHETPGMAALGGPGIDRLVDEEGRDARPR